MTAAPARPRMLSGLDFQPHQAGIGVGARAPRWPDWLWACREKGLHRGSQESAGSPPHLIWPEWSSPHRPSLHAFHVPGPLRDLE